MTNEHFTDEHVPPLSKDEEYWEQMRMRRLRRKRAQEEATQHRASPFAVIVLDRGTGDHFLMPSSPD